MVVRFCCVGGTSSMTLLVGAGLLCPQTATAAVNSRTPCANDEAYAVYAGEGGCWRRVLVRDRVAWDFVAVRVPGLRALDRVPAQGIMGWSGRRW